MSVADYCHVGFRRARTWKALSKPDVPVVPLAEAKTWLRLRSDIHDHDQLIESLIKASDESFEGITSTSTLIKSYNSGFRGWASVFELPRAPVTEISSVGYYKPGETIATPLDPSDWELSLTATGVGHVIFPSSYTFPTYDSDRLDPIEVNFKAGYADSWEGLPSRVIVCLKYYLSAYYNQGSPLVIGADVKKTPYTLDCLLSSLTAYGIGEGMGT